MLWHEVAVDWDWLQLCSQVLYFDTLKVYNINFLWPQRQNLQFILLKSTNSSQALLFLRWIVLSIDNHLFCVNLLVVSKLQRQVIYFRARSSIFIYRFLFSILFFNFFDVHHLLLSFSSPAFFKSRLWLFNIFLLRSVHKLGNLCCQ